MPFGLCNAPATYQHIMDIIVKKEQWKFVNAYLDDIIIFSESIYTTKDTYKSDLTN